MNKDISVLGVNKDISVLGVNKDNYYRFVPIPIFLGIEVRPNCFVFRKYVKSNCMKWIQIHNFIFLNIPSLLWY